MQNAFIECFNGTFRYDSVNHHWFRSARCSPPVKTGPMCSYAQQTRTIMEAEAVEDLLMAWTETNATPLDNESSSTDEKQ
jgi:hypothetical protein